MLIEDTTFPSKEVVQPAITIIAVGVHDCSYFSEIVSCYLTDFHNRLHSIPPVRVVVIGCGDGQTSIDLAIAYPRIRVDGYDIDNAAIENAWTNARKAGVTDRTTFHVWDVADDTLNGRYDFVVSSMSLPETDRPVDVLKTMHRLVKRNGNTILLAKQTEVEILCRYATEAGFSCADFLSIDCAEG